MPVTDLLSCTDNSFHHKDTPSLLLFRTDPSAACPDKVKVHPDHIFVWQYLTYLSKYLSRSYHSHPVTAVWWFLLFHRLCQLQFHPIYHILLINHANIHTMHHREYYPWTHHRQKQNHHKFHILPAFSSSFLMMIHLMTRPKSLYFDFSGSSALFLFFYRKKKPSFRC